MIGGLTGVNSYYSTTPIVWTRSVPAANPGTPVEATSPVTAVPQVTQTGSEQERTFNSAEIMKQWETDPVAYAVRSRIQYPDETESAQTPDLSGAAVGDEKAAAVPGADEEPVTVDGDTKSAQEVMEEGECQTCKNRKYQDGSDDPGVSFQTPTHIDPDVAASQVRGHEMEHVTREQASADREGRKVVSQSVTYHTAICPECGRVYVSGGTTRTVTAADSTSNDNADTGYDGKDAEDEQNPMLAALAA